jgi:hypothetical protein
VKILALVDIIQSQDHREGIMAKSYNPYDNGRLLEIKQGLMDPPRTYTADATAAATDYVIFCSHASVAIDLTLPTSGIPVGKPFIIKRAGAAATVVKGTIDGDTDFELVTENDSVTVLHIGDGAYEIISAYTQAVEAE